LCCTYSVRDSAPNSTPYFSSMPPFGNALHSGTPQSAPAHIR